MVHSSNAISTSHSILWLITSLFRTRFLFWKGLGYLSLLIVFCYWKAFIYIQNINVAIILRKSVLFLSHVQLQWESSIGLMISLNWAILMCNFLLISFLSLFIIILLKGILKLLWRSTIFSLLGLNIMRERTITFLWIIDKSLWE